MMPEINALFSGPATIHLFALTIAAHTQQMSESARTEAEDVGAHVVDGDD